MIINFLFAGLIGHVVNLINEEKKNIDVAMEENIL